MHTGTPAHLRPNSAELLFQLRHIKHELDESFCQRLKCSKNRTALLNFVATHFHHWRQLLDPTSAVNAADVDASTSSVYVGIAIDAERSNRITEYLQGP